MPTLKVRKPLKWVFPIGISNRYQKLLSGMTRQWKNAAKNIIISRLPFIIENANAFKNPIATNVKSDSINLDQDWVEEVDQTMADYDEEVLLLLTPLFLRAIEQTGQNTQVFNLTQWKKIVQDALNFSIFPSEPWLAAHMKSFVDENVSLIKKLSRETSEDIKGIINRGIKQGKKAVDIERQIMSGTKLKAGRFKKTINRAKLIADDQINKLNGQLQELRQTDLGLTRFEWRTRRDERVRATHRPLEGKICSWEDSTIYFDFDGNKRSRSGIGATNAQPGQEIRCRCVAVPIFTSSAQLEQFFSISERFQIG